MGNKSCQNESQNESQNDLTASHLHVNFIAFSLIGLITISLSPPFVKEEAVLGILQNIWTVKPFFLFNQLPVLFHWKTSSVSLRVGGSDDWGHETELCVPSALCDDDAGRICLDIFIVAFRPALVINRTLGARKIQANALTLRLIDLIHCKFGPILNDTNMKMSDFNCAVFPDLSVCPFHYYLQRKGI